MSDPMEAKAIGEVLGVSPQRVDQIRNRALEKLRALMSDDDAPGSDDPWHSLPGFAPGCRQVGALRWRK